MRGKKEFSVEAQPTSGFYTSGWIGFRTQKEACQAFLQINSHSAFSEVQLQALELCTKKTKIDRITDQCGAFVTKIPRNLYFLNFQGPPGLPGMGGPKGEKVSRSLFPIAVSSEL